MILDQSATAMAAGQAVGVLSTTTPRLVGLGEDGHAGTDQGAWGQPEKRAPARAP